MQIYLFFRRTFSKLFHVTDWFPTIMTMAGMSLQDIPTHIDGVNQYSAIFEENPQPARTEIIHEIREDNFRGGYGGALRTQDGFKILRNPSRTPLFDTYHLYNIELDPSESVDLKRDFPEVFQELKDKLEVQ